MKREKQKNEFWDFLNYFCIYIFYIIKGIISDNYKWSSIAKRKRRVYY